MSTAISLRQGLVSNMSGKMVAEVHSIRRSVDGEIKDFTSFLSQDDWDSDWGMHFIDSRGVHMATLLVRGGEPVRC